ncbi:MAG: IS6 family transposase [bacterium]
MKCPKCSSSDYWKNGIKENGEQLFKCKDCFFQFTKRSQKDYLRMRFPSDIIKYAQKLVFYYGLSTWKASALFKDLGVDVSNKAIHIWTYEKNIEDAKKEFNKELTGIWYCDETFVKVKGKTGYLWVVKDSSNNVIVLYLSKRRTSKAAKKALRLAYERAGFKPHTIITDGYSSYPSAIRKVFPKAEHIQSGIKGINEDHLFSTNVVEGYNSKIKTMYHTRRGFKSWKNAANYFSKFELYNCFMNNEELDMIKPCSIPT